tara:strand:+ start:3552 stop:3806 length:255 start_codon:yes stop_codon:yes gene_type:complete
METKTDPVLKVNWNNTLIYLNNFINEKLMDIIYNHNLNEEDACKLLSISEEDIYSAKEEYFIRNVKREVLSQTFGDSFNWALAR